MCAIITDDNPSLVHHTQTLCYSQQVDLVITQYSLNYESLSASPEIHATFS